jgi:hypothetical protein
MGVWDESTKSCENPIGIQVRAQDDPELVQGVATVVPGYEAQPLASNWGGPPGIGDSHQFRSLVGVTSK